MNPFNQAAIQPIPETAPELFLVLTPGLTIVAASNKYSEIISTKTNTIVGRELMELLSQVTENKNAGFLVHLKGSLQNVLTQKQPDQMAVQNFYIATPDGKWEEKYWKLSHTPVFNEHNEIAYIIQNITDAATSPAQTNKLKNSEYDYQLLVNSVRDYALFMITPDGAVASWNSGAERIKGYTSTEIIGRPIELFYTADDIKNGIPKKNLQTALQYGHYETEGWRIKKNGDLFWANAVITALRDERGDLYGYSKITRDITEKKKAQNQIEFLSLQINQAHDAIYTVDAAFKIKSWNKGAQKLYGFTVEEALGQDSNIILRTAISQEQINQILKEIANTDYWSGEIKRKTKEGRDIYVLSSNSTIRDQNGTIVGYTAVSFDITEQKRLREQVNHLAAIVEQSSEAIISRGLDQRMLTWNKGAEALFGYTKEEAIGKTAIELGFVKMTAEEFGAIGQLIMETGTWKSERVFYHKNGSSFFGSVAANAVRNENGDISSIVFIIKDISLHKQLEERLKKHNEELEEKVKLRTEHILKTESRFRALIENNYDIISLMDESFRIIYRSPSATRITGWTDEEMMNANGIQNIHPDDIAAANNIVTELMAKPGTPINCLFRNSHKNGHYLWMEGTVINLLQDENVHAIVFNFRDVTERIEAEEKRKASENRFRALIENSNDIITLMDENFRLIYRSPAATKVLGWTDEDMMGIEATTNIHPDDKAYATQVVKEVMANPGKTVTTKFRMGHKQGHYLWLEGMLTNLLQDQSVQAVVFNFRNITQRVEAEEKLRDSEIYFRTTLDNMLEGIQVIDFDWRYIYVNDALTRYSRYSSKELLGHTIMELYPGVEKTDLYKSLAACMNERKPQRLETEFVFPDGSKADFELSMRPVPEGIFILSMDITEKKKAEQDLKKSFEEKETLSERLSIILNTLPATIALLDSNGCIIEVNEAWRNSADDNGLTGSAYCIGHNYIDITKNATGKGKKDGEKVAKGITDVLTKKEQQFVFEYPCHTVQEERWFRMIVTPLHHTDYGGVVVMHTDISEVRRLEQERLKSKTEEQHKITQAMLQGQEKERTAIGAELHDNVNQILVATKLLLSIGKNDPKKTKDFIVSSIENIQNAIDENRKIAHDLVAPDMKTTDFREELINLTTKMLGISGIEVSIDTNNFNEELPDDQRKLATYRILQEQCTNIVKYANAHNVSVLLDTTGKLFTMRIADDGKGMESGKITDGIGLKNIKGRLSIFNGSATINSAPGKGFTLEIQIPLE